MACRVDLTEKQIAEQQALERDRLTGPLREEIFKLKQELEAREAMLCAVFTILEKGFTSHGITFYLDAVLAQINWQEAGVTRYDTEEWWEDHKDRDAVRKEREALEREVRRREILARLTPEEREILGVKL